MKSSIIWLVRFGIDQGVFSLKAAWAVRMKVGEDAELLDFAQELLDSGHVEEEKVEILERIAGLAQAKGQGAAPIDDPFEAPGTRQPFAEPAAASAPAPVAPAASAPAGQERRVPEPVREPVREPAKEPVREPVAARVSAPEAAVVYAGSTKLEFPFEQVAKMADDELRQRLTHLLKTCARQGVSDLHLSAGAKPFIRRQRVLSPLGEGLLAAEDALRLNTILLATHQRETFLERKDLDYALALDEANRYRVNLMFHKWGAAGSYRMVAAEVPKLDALGLRNIEAVRKLLTYHNGLILVTGPVGAGKTTTLAALVAELNEKRKDHIITVEDPIEVVQGAKGCNITQREVGPHTKSFATALKGALREDPDVIVIGELRDLETIEMAISASETGHLVIGTMHTSDAATTLNRLLDVFPPAQQTQIRASVAESLRGVICQRLLPATEGGLVMACEILIGNPAVAALIREGKTSGLRNVLETGQREGMCLMEGSVFNLYTEKRISAAVARENIINRVLRARIA